MKTRNRLLAILVSLAVIFSSISFSSMAFGEEKAIGEEFTLETTTIDDGKQLEDEADEPTEQENPGEPGEEELGESEESEEREELDEEEDPATETGEGEESEDPVEGEITADPDNGEETEEPGKAEDPEVEEEPATEPEDDEEDNLPEEEELQDEQVEDQDIQDAIILNNSEFLLETTDFLPMANPNQYSIKTTDITGNNVNDNFYNTKQDVYVRIDGEAFEYWVFVVSPNGTMLGKGGPFAPNVLFNLYEATGFADTDNNGDNYNVWVGLVSEFNHSEMKNDHFKVEKQKPAQMGQIKIQKNVITLNHVPVPNDNGVFEFKIQQEVEGQWVDYTEGAPYIVNGNGSITLTVPVGNYRVAEEETTGYQLWLGGSNQNQDKEVKKDKTSNWKFANKKLPPPVEIKGSINITKYLYDESEELITNDNTDFTFILYKFENDDWVEKDSMTLKAGLSDSFTDLSAGRYKVTEVNIPQGYILISANNQEVTINTNGQIELLDFDNMIDATPWEGNIRVVKTIKDKPNADLEGFKFELYKNNLKIAGPLQTDEYGEVEFEGLAAGEYEIREVAVEGYTAHYTNGRFIEIGPDIDGDDGNLYIFRVENKEVKEWNKGKLIVSKAKLGLPGKWGIRPIESPRDIVFTLEGENLEETLEATTNGLGFAAFDNLMEGTYILKEIVPEGYESSLPEEGLEVKIEDKLFKKIVTVRVVNKKVPDWKGKLIIQKEIRSGEEVPQFTTLALPDLSGFEFQLWMGDDLVAGPKLTDPDGRVEFTDLPAGTYIIKETDSKGLIPDGPFEVEISEELADNKNVIEITFINRTIPLRDIVVQKRVSNDSDLSGFTFRLYRVEYDGYERYEDFVEAKTTDASGIVTFEDQPDGEYVIYEDIRAGYVMGIGAVGSKNGREFYHSDNMIYPIEVDNRKLPPPTGEIDISKRVVNQNNNTIEDDNAVFTFRLYKLVEEEWVEVLSESPFTITGNDTVTIDNLPLGEYRVVEVSIPAGYQLITENNLEVELDEETDEVKAEFTNRRVPPPPPTGEIDVSKRVVNQNNEVVDDTATFMFRLYRLVEENWVEILSESPFFITGNGTVTIDNLPLGEYRVVEVSIPSGYELVTENNVQVELELQNLEVKAEFTNRRDDTPPPPSRGEIDVSKRVIDEDDNVIEDDNTRFMFRLYRLVEGEWEEVLSESPFFITGNGTVTIDNLPQGEYRIIEVEIPSGYSLDSANNLEVEMDSENLEGKAEFTNKKDDIPPPPPTRGEIEVTKIVQRRNGDIFEGNGTRFHFELDMRIDDRWVTIDDGFIDGNGSLVFRDLEDGEYRVREVDIDSGFDLISRNNLLVEIEDGSEEEVEFINRRVPPTDDDDDDDDDDDTPPPPPTPTPTPTPPEIEEIPEVIPEAPPVVEEVPDVLEEVEVIEEPVPEAAPEVKPTTILPRTGSTNPMLFSGLGGIILALGLFLKKKED